MNNLSCYCGNNDCIDNECSKCGIIFCINKNCFEYRQICEICYELCCYDCMESGEDNICIECLENISEEEEDE